MTRIVAFALFGAALGACGSQPAAQAQQPSVRADRAAPGSSGAPALTLTVSGAPEIVIPAEQMNCGAARRTDIPNMPPSAYRRGDGQVVMLAGNRSNFIFAGPTLDRVRRPNCEQLLKLTGDPDPSHFQDQEYLLGVVPLAGGQAIGVVHDEYHGDYHGDADCRGGGEDKLCWYAATTLVTSRDGGRTFQRPPQGQNVLAAPPARYQPGVGRVSASAPKLIRRGDYLYTMVASADRNRGRPGVQCLLRASVSSPLVWRAWDGRGFNLAMGSPYANPDRADCTGVVRGNVSAVKWVPSKNLYVLTTMSREEVRYQTSPDLIRWSAPASLYDVPARTAGREPVGDREDGGHTEWYFSILDPASPSPSFDTIGAAPYLYFARFLPRDRDGQRRGEILRVKLSLS